MFFFSINLQLPLVELRP